MASILETSMLFCFGLSWPINAYKNYKAGTAKNMSIPFILLILFGYVAGIAAKLCTHSVNYVFYIYILNLLIVSVNILVYFRNRALDQQKDAQVQKLSGAEKPTVQLPESIKKELGMYERMNHAAADKAVVIFGDDTFRDVPFCELAQQGGLTETIYNRCFRELSVTCASLAAEQVIPGLHPEKIFLQLGAAEADDAATDCDAFMEDYQWLLYTLHLHTSAKLYIVSICSDTSVAQELNRRLRNLAAESGCTFIALSGTRPSALQIFEQMRVHLRTHPITFLEAMRT